VREVCILAIAGECDNAFVWAAHGPEALRVGVPQQISDAIRIRAPTADMDAPFGTVVELIREAFTARSVSATTSDAAAALLAYGISSIWCVAGRDLCQHRRATPLALNRSAHH
jgi:hypothetical protein